MGKAGSSGFARSIDVVFIMDFNEELDYEEGDLQSTECNDHYLQIDISEEEENLIFEETKKEKEKQVSSKMELPNKNDDNKKMDSAEKNCEAVKKNDAERFSGTLEKNSLKAFGAVKTQKEDLFDKTHISQSTKGYKHTYYNKKNDVRKQAQFSPKLGGKHLETKNLPEVEKEIMNSKKEARLKRFKHENSLKGRKLDSSLHNYKTSGNISLLNAQNPIITRVQNKGTLQEKPNINKELLLRKKNPFDENLEASNKFLKGAIKRESEKIKAMEGNIKLFVASRTQHQPLGKEEGDISFGYPNSVVQSCRMINNVAESRVKFVRTVSKTFYELTLRNKNCLLEKTLSEAELHSLNSCKTSGLPESSENTYFSVEDSTQVPSQLIGCIVKVLNSPPSITVNDVLALCSPIGIVEEIKLNYPKENSVVIRFADSTCAEKFFKVYHGQKINNYLLNVILV